METISLTTDEKIKITKTIIFSVIVFVLSLVVLPTEYFVISTFPVFIALRSIERSFLNVGKNQSKI